MDQTRSRRSGKKSAPQILIVEDDEWSRILFTDVLSAKGYATRAAATGTEALQALRESRPDLILMDVMIRDMSGFELIGAVKEKDTLRSVPIIVATSLPPYLFRDRIAGLGCDAYIAKPVSILTLWAVVRHLLATCNVGKGATPPLSRCLADDMI